MVYAFQLIYYLNTREFQVKLNDYMLQKKLTIKKKESRRVKQKKGGKMFLLQRVVDVTLRNEMLRN